MTSHSLRCLAQGIRPNANEVKVEGLILMWAQLPDRGRIPDSLGQDQPTHSPVLAGVSPNPRPQCVAFTSS